jgi:hypothetical protein
MMRHLFLLAAAFLFVGCAGGAAKSDDPHMLIRIINAGTEPLQCRLMFGHWVDRDLGLVTRDNGAAGNLFVMLQQQQEDGALYVMRDDGQRRMMVENIFCARPDDWQATVGQIDLASVRTAKPASAWVTCALPESGGKVVCGKPRFWLRGSSTVVQ